MRAIIRCVLFLLVIGFISCRHEKVCSGLNPEIGKYNTSSKVRKGRRQVHSGPEKQAVSRHAKQVKHKQPRNGGKSNPVRHGISGVFHFGGRVSAGGSAHVGGGGESNKQKR
jgi:hypothetical protein